MENIDVRHTAHGSYDYPLGYTTIRFEGERTGIIFSGRPNSADVYREILHRLGYTVTFLEDFAL